MGFNTNILTYNTNEGFTLDTTNLMNSFIYYSGIYYSSPILGNNNTDLSNYDKLLTNIKCILLLKKIYFYQMIIIILMNV